MKAIIVFRSLSIFVLGGILILMAQRTAAHELSRAQLSTQATATAAPQPWQKKTAPLQTQWYAQVSPTNAHPEYPRPQLVRDSWQNLNGLWQFAAATDGQTPPFGQTLAEQVLVPYPIESALSGIMRHEDRMWYRTTFSTPTNWRGQHVMLHFGAVDWQSTIYLNGHQIGIHQGGYDGFSVDLTANLLPDMNELIVNVYAPVDSAGQPRGKQVKHPRDIWYTASSGIWQTVWLEPVLQSHVNGLTLVPDIDAGVLRVTVNTADMSAENNAASTAVVTGTPSVTSSDETVHIIVLDNNQTVASVTGSTNQELTLPIPNAKLWSPDMPFLYDLQVTLNNSQGMTDKVTSYFGMRKISVGAAASSTAAGATRILLNNHFVFQIGPLDQGFWPEGGYTAPTDDALKYDLEQEKAFGWNMVRKHIKVEPDRWYYWADKLGLLVWQDMPSEDADNKIAEPPGALHTELIAMINGRRNHPSIVMWVIFNEGWGQSQFGLIGTAKLTRLVRQLDPTRLISSATGWVDYGISDIVDLHCYVGPCAPKPEVRRASVDGEFGGVGLDIAGHTWPGKSFSYQAAFDSARLTQAYIDLLSTASPNLTTLMSAPGLSAAVYTEVTDIEQEHNGFITYDRAVIKIDVQRVAAANKALIALSTRLGGQ